MRRRTFRTWVLLVLVAALVGCSGAKPKETGPGDGPAANPGGAPPAGKGTEWCAAGAAWSAQGMGGQGEVGQFQAKVIGVTTFKGKSYCQAEYRIDAGGQKALYTYYFSENGKDVWMLMDVNGQKQEMHLSQDS